MAAKITYTAKGADPSTIIWPFGGPPSERFIFVSGTPLVVHSLIAYPSSGTITFPDGRAFPAITAAASTFIHSAS